MAWASRVNPIPDGAFPATLAAEAMDSAEAALIHAAAERMELAKSSRFVVFIYRPRCSPLSSLRQSFKQELSTGCVA